MGHKMCILLHPNVVFLVPQKPEVYPSWPEWKVNFMTILNASNKTADTTNAY